MTDHDCAASAGGREERVRGEGERGGREGRERKEGRKRGEGERGGRREGRERQRGTCKQEREMGRGSKGKREISGQVDGVYDTLHDTILIHLSHDRCLCMYDYYTQPQIMT